MKSYEMLMSKTIWAGTLLVLVGIYNTAFNGGLDVQPILTGIGLIGLRQAV